MCAGIIRRDYEVLQAIPAPDIIGEPIPGGRSSIYINEYKVLDDRPSEEKKDSAEGAAFFS